MPSCSSFTASFSPADVLSGYISVYFSLSENVVGAGSVAGAVEVAVPSPLPRQP